MITSRRWGECGRVNLPLPVDAGDKRDKGKRMFRNGNRLSKLIAVVGVVSLMMALLVSRASAQVTTFSNKNYNGSYACRDASDFDFFTAVFQYTPNGAGGYTTGTLVATLNNFTGFDSAAPAAQFCTFLLQTAASAYSIDTTGLGFETLTWLPSAGNNAACFPAAFFVNQTQIALRNLTSSNGATIRAEFSDDNLLDEDDPGHGTCVGG
jgi:hypothetical protein